PNNGWSHIVVSWTFNNLAGSNQDRLRIWVDGVLQATTAFTTTNTVSPQIGTLYIGDNRSSISPVGRSAGNPGGGGNASLDEFRIYNFEGGLALVQRDMNQITACLAHYAIAHAGSGQACQSQNVTITAHDASHNPIIMPNNTTTIVLSTSTGQGDWSLVSGWGTFSNGTAGDGIATYLWNGEYQAVFALNHPAAGTVNINVTDGQIAESATEDPPLVLNACFSKFNACHNYTGSNCSAANGRLYTRLAGVGFDTDVVALTDTDTVATSFTGKAQVSVIARASPGGPVDAQNCFTPDYTLFLDNATTSFTSGRLNLTNQVVPQAYRDVRIKVTCDATHCPPSGMTWCSTDNFAIRPQGFAVSAKLGEQPVEQLKAGHGFTLEANSNVSAQYTGTPALDTSRLRDHNNNPAGSITGAFSAGTGAVASGTFQYHDVGTLSLLADAVTDATFTSVDQPSDCVSGSTSNTLSAGKYGCVIGSAAAGPFGRFYPDHFTFAATLTPACSSGFSYMDQPALGINLAMTARSSNGAVTTRYTAGYPYLGTFSITGDNGGTPVSLSRLDPALPPFVWNNGSYTVNVTNTKFTRGSSPDGPYENFALKANILSEPDGVALSGGALSNTTRIRYGRIKLGNAHGSELLPLPIPFSLEYYNAGSWTKNLLDTCTSITASSFALAFPPAPSNHLAACETAMAITGSAPGFQPKLFAPGAGNDGWTDVTLNLGATASGSACMAQGASAVPATTVNAPWLQYPGNSNPTSRATFGLYKNANELIYLRENY
ncbi:MAG: hypothetical protein N2Z69_09055, partial [Methylophilaceae bacterium]|nr:hypothetical protein [Methylophilaceae bacterium]